MRAFKTGALGLFVALLAACPEKPVAPCLKGNNACNSCKAEMDDKTLLALIEAQLEKADAEMAVQNWEEANTLLKQALAELGACYARSDTLDDSGMKLIEADMLEEEGKLDEAAHVRRRIFAERLEMFKGKTQ